MNDIRVTDTHVFFWGSPLSNFYPCTIEWGGEKFLSSEQLFMWFKAIYFADEETANLILKTTTPKEAKELGRKVRGFDEKMWSTVREEYMKLALHLKFTQNKTLRQYLLQSTFDGKKFVEGSPYDKIWGIGIAWDDPTGDDESTWKGQNLLGKCLNEIRCNILKKIVVL